MGDKIFQGGPNISVTYGPGVQIFHYRPYNRTKWQPAKENVICDMHYLNVKGPSRPDNNVIPIYFKRPRSNPATNYIIMYQRKEDCIQRATRAVENASARSTDDLQTEQYSTVH